MFIYHAEITLTEELFSNSESTLDIKINRSRLKILYTKDPKSAGITE